MASKILKHVTVINTVDVDAVRSCFTQQLWCFGSSVVLLFQTEIILTKASQGGKTAAKTSTFLPRMPPNPTRIDHLIVSQIQEQAKVGRGPTLPSPDHFLTAIFKHFFFSS